MKGDCNFGGNLLPYVHTVYKNGNCVFICGVFQQVGFVSGWYAAKEWLASKLLALGISDLFHPATWPPQTCKLAS